MISWIIFSPQGDKIEESKNKSVLSGDELKKIILFPFKRERRENYHQFGRTINEQHVDVFVWSPAHQIIVNKEIEERWHVSIEKYSVKKIWEMIPQLIRNFQDNFLLRLNNEKMLIEFEIDGDHISLDLNLFIGYYGYISFETGRILENYKNRGDDLYEPSIVLEFPSQFVIRHEKYIIYLEFDLLQIIIPAVYLTQKNEGMFENRIYHTTDYPDYISDLQHIIEHIKNGDIYQANYTQQFIVPTPDIELFEIYGDIKATQKLPYAAFLHYSKGFQIMSLSPELFLLIHQGNIITKPIKGTRPRGNTSDEDRRFVEELTRSEKDQAELAMIVDLLRNDLGKTALPGSVEVTKHAEIESYENVHHLVSTVSAKIPTSLEDSWRLLLRAFPGGSISGVPKLRSLEIIEKHEKTVRGIYTGNIGYLGLNGDLEFNIAIRTVIQQGTQTVFHAGGGIVLDSDPFEEYIESLHKAKHIANYLKYSFIGHIVYYNGHFRAADHMQTKPNKNGVFETLRVENGNIANFEYHEKRIKRGITEMKLTTSIPNEIIIEQFLRLNLITFGKYRMNIYIWIDELEREHILMKISQYQTPSDEFNLVLADTPIEVPGMIVKGLKSLDYERYQLATQSAQQKNHWDTILYDENNQILEGGRSTIYFYRDNQWFTPKSQVVHGIIRQILLEKEIVKEKDIKVDEFLQVDEIAVSNALIGVQPIRSIIRNNKEVWNGHNKGNFSLLKRYTQD